MIIDKVISLQKYEHLVIKKKVNVQEQVLQTKFILKERNKGSSDHDRCHGEGHMQHGQGRKGRKETIVQNKNKKNEIQDVKGVIFPKFNDIIA